MKCVRFCFATMIAIYLAPCLFGDDSTAGIELAWRGRQESIRSATFELSIETHHPKGSQSRAFPNPQIAGKILPGSALNHSYRTIVLIEGANVKIDEDGYQWNSTKGEFIKAKRITTSSNKGNQQFLESTTGPSSGNVVPSTNYTHFLMPNYRPLVYYCRPLRTDSVKINQFDIADFQVDGQSLFIDRMKCTPFKSKRMSQLKLWIDESPDRFVVKEHLNIGHFAMTTAIKYGKIGGVVVPKEWTLQDVFSDGSNGKQTRVVVEKFILNETLAADDFEIKYPPNTSIFKFSNKEDGGHVESRSFVDELGEIQQLPRQGNGGSYLYYFIAICAVAIAVVYYRYIIRKQY